MVHRRHRGLCKQFRKQAHHHATVLQHVGDAGRRAAVVFEHLEVVGPGAHDVDAHDMAVDLARRGEVGHFRQIGAVLVDDVGGHDARLHDFAAMIDIVQEGVQGAGALAELLRQAKQLPPPSTVLLLL